MKPTTKLQKQVVELSSQLPKISDKQSQWAFKKCFDSYATQLRSNLYCLECGNTWKDETPNWHNEIVGCVCPECKTELKMFNHNGNCRKTEYFSVLTSKDNFQVQRVVMVHKEMKKKTVAKNYFVEVIQHWIGADGKKTTLSLACNGMSMYYDQWIYGSGLEIRTQSNNSNLRDNLNVFSVYPNRKILPIIKRNGFKGNFYNLPPFKVFSSLLTKGSISEMLLKTNQIELFKDAVENNLSIPVAWLVAPIKTCVRNNYIIKDISLWKDYIQLLVYFGKDTSNSKYACPIDLNNEHNKLVEKKRNIQRKMDLEKLRTQIEKAEVPFNIQKSMFFGLSFISKNITIKVIESVREFMEEGDVLNHCLFRNEYYEKEDSLCFSARIDGKSIETIEVSISKMKILQSRGLLNKPTKFHSKIINLVNENLNSIRLIANKNPAKAG